LEKFINIIGSGIRDLPACGTTLPRTIVLVDITKKNLSNTSPGLYLHVQTSQFGQKHSTRKSNFISVRSVGAGISSVHILTGYGSEEWDLSPGWGRNSSLSYRINVGSGFDSASPRLWVTGTFAPETKHPYPKGDFSPPSIAEVINTSSVTSTPLYVFIG
jgi:hypothetical protein